MRSRQMRVPATLLLAFIGSCGDSLLAPTPNAVNGTWAEEFEVVGSSNVWQLLAQDTVVTGTGGWSAEACCGGTLTIAGHIRGNALHLSVTSAGLPLRVVPPADSTAHYVAVLLSPTEMSVAEETDPTTPVFRMRKQ